MLSVCHWEPACLVLCFYMARQRRNGKVLCNYTAAAAAAAVLPNQTVPCRSMLKQLVHFYSVRINGLCHSC